MSDEREVDTNGLSLSGDGERERWIKKVGLRAKLAYRLRRRRDVIFGPLVDFMGEPVWDLLLDLCGARVERRAVSVTSAIIAAGVPLTTGLRVIARLERAGVLARRADKRDKRRTFIFVTEYGFELVAQSLADAPVWMTSGADFRSVLG